MTGVHPLNRGAQIDRPGQPSFTKYSSLVHHLEYLHVGLAGNCHHYISLPLLRAVGSGAAWATRLSCQFFSLWACVCSMGVSALGCIYIGHVCDLRVCGRVADVGMVML